MVGCRAYKAVGAMASLRLSLNIKCLTQSHRILENIQRIRDGNLTIVVDVGCIKCPFVENACANLRLQGIQRIAYAD